MGMLNCEDSKIKPILLAGIAHNLTTLTSAYGAVDVQGLTEDDFTQITKLRKQEEGKDLETTSPTKKAVSHKTD